MQKGPSCRAHFSAGPCSQGSESARSPSKTGLGTKARSSGGGQVCDSPWATVCAAQVFPILPTASERSRTCLTGASSEANFGHACSAIRDLLEGARVALHSNACKTQPRRISDFTTHSTPVLLLKHNCHSDFIAHTPCPFRSKPTETKSTCCPLPQRSTFPHVSTSSSLSIHMPPVEALTLSSSHAAARIRRAATHCESNVSTPSKVGRT